MNGDRGTPRVDGAEPLNPDDDSLSPKIQQILHKAKTTWLRNKELCTILKNHQEYGFKVQTNPPWHPPGGTLFLIDRKEVRYFRMDGHNWRKRPDNKAVQETHEKLKVDNADMLNCYYAHSDQPHGLQRRCYWLLEDKDTVLVHYLNSTMARSRANWTKQQAAEDLATPTAVPPASIACPHPGDVPELHRHDTAVSHQAPQSSPAGPTQGSARYGAAPQSLPQERALHQEASTVSAHSEQHTWQQQPPPAPPQQQQQQQQQPQTGLAGIVDTFWTAGAGAILESHLQQLRSEVKATEDKMLELNASLEAELQSHEPRQALVAHWQKTVLRLFNDKTDLDSRIHDLSNRIASTSAVVDAASASSSNGLAATAAVAASRDEAEMLGHAALEHRASTPSAHNNYDQHQQLLQQQQQQLLQHMQAQEQQATAEKYVQNRAGGLLGSPHEHQQQATGVGAEPEELPHCSSFERFRRKRAGPTHEHGDREKRPCW